MKQMWVRRKPDAFRWLSFVDAQFFRSKEWHLIYDYNKVTGDVRVVGDDGVYTIQYFDARYDDPTIWDYYEEIK